MKVRIAKSRRMPTLDSYYISRFNEETLELLKESKPFTFYHKDLQEYELTREIYERIQEKPESIKDERVFVVPFQRKSKELYGYQQDAVEFARARDNILVNFPQGMGKSLTTMKILDDRKVLKTLIVCGQGNLQEEWLKDAVKHGYAEKLNFNIVGEDTGTSQPKKVQWIRANAQNSGVDLINIEALRNVDIVSAINYVGYDAIVVDEVQSAKGMKAEQTKGLHEITRTVGQLRIALSGTPVLNNPLEYFSLLKFLGALQDTSRTTFEKYYGTWSFDFWGHYVCKGYINLDELNELLDQLICTADKAELNLPPKTRKVIELKTFKDQEFEMLKALYKKPIAKIKRAGYNTKPAIRARMELLSATNPEKLNFIKNCEGKLLVFSKSTEVLDWYEQHLAERKVLYYHGKLSMKERLSVLEEWHSGKYDILLLSLSTARYGLNLVEADKTIFVEPPASLGTLEQAEDRAYRIGQTKPVTSYLLASTKIDDDALENILSKQEALETLEALRDNKKNITK